MRARYYSPEMRRFVNADILHGGISEAITLNRYAYANGNPVSFVDPFGLKAVDTTGDAIWLQYKDGALGLGHTGLLLQDSDGIWYLFYWGTKHPKKAILSGNHELIDSENIWSNKGTHEFDPDSGEAFIDDINDFIYLDPKIIPDNQLVTGAIYFEGDFQKSVDAIDAMMSSLEENGKYYNLYTNNCLQRSVDALLAGTFDDNDDLYKEKLKEVVSFDDEIKTSAAIADAIVQTSVDATNFLVDGINSLLKKEWRLPIKKINYDKWVSKQVENVESSIPIVPNDAYEQMRIFRKYVKYLHPKE